MRARCTLATGIAVVCATTLGLAQTTPSEQQRQSGQRDDQRTVTVVGCLQEEKDVHGQRPNVAERAGVGEDFILTQAKMKSGSSSSEKGTSGTSGSTGTGSTTPGGSSASGSPGMTGSQAMYKIKDLDDEKLRPLVNKRVEVVGKVETQSSRSRGAVETGSTGPTGSGTTGTATTGTPTTGTTSPGGTATGAREASRTDQHDMAELHATSIKEVAGSCQSTQ
jgi:hypothetical protein